MNNSWIYYRGHYSLSGETVPSQIILAYTGKVCYAEYVK